MKNIFKRKKKHTRQITVGLRTQLCKECHDHQMRPCEVAGQPCLFHRWAEDDQVLMNCNSTSQDEAEKMIQQFKANKIAGPNFSTEVMRHTYALVEYPDGSIGKVKPELVTFLDKEGKA